MTAKNPSAQERLIDEVNFPKDFRSFSLDQLEQFANELREETICKVAKIGGHLGAGLGVVELTVALHYVFNTPKDLLVWDVGHQTYPHKIITGRKDKMHTLRQVGGLSGFPKRCESEYDTFGVGHSSTSISAALGMAVGRDINQEQKNVIAVIGDGAFTAGMAYEAMNNAGHLKNRLFVILNDNEMSIAPNVGALTKALSRLISSKPFLKARHFAKNLIHELPEPIENITKKFKRYAKDLITGGNFFEEFGFHYVGPLDGHDVKEMVQILQNLRDDTHIESPILIHIKTQKGKGFDAPFSCGESYHAVAKFDIESKIQIKSSTVTPPTYTKVLGEALTRILANDEKCVAITAAMPSGTGLNIVAKAFPDRVYDVGIAEQHAVTFSAGLTTQGIKPFCAIYSTFLQRAYDQVIHDVAIQKLPVRFILDRAGIVGADGATHAGTYDLAYLSCLPGMVIMAPADEGELVRMLATAYEINDKPSVIRFPRGEGIGVDLPEPKALEIGKGRIIREGKKVAILSIGTRLQEALKAADHFAQNGLDITVADARFAKPIDTQLITKLAKNHDILITIEEGAAGGFGSHVAQFLAENGLLDNKLKYRSMFLPDYFINHNTQTAIHEEVGLNASGIISKIESLLGKKVAFQEAV